MKQLLLGIGDHRCRPAMKDHERRGQSTRAKPVEVFMRLKAFAVLAATSVCLLGAQGAFSWGSLTHVFITNQLVAQSDESRYDAVYGSTTPDFANFMFSSPYQEYLMEKTHTDYMQIWKMARGGPKYRSERALAYGFVAHNAQDYTAHFMSRHLDPASGYVIQKAAILNEMLAYYGVWASLGLDGDAFAFLREGLAHELIEFAGDYLIALMAPDTGQLLSDAAVCSSGDLASLLVRAYAGETVAFSNRSGIRLNQPSAAGILAAGESMFREFMAAYGYLFTNDNPVELLADLAVFLQMMAAQRGIIVTDLDQLTQILYAAVYVIQDDFAFEIYKTIPFTAEELAARKVAY
ncbi:MAG TPA: zinc dependent phospholipase C family protein [Acidobacteriota bacterium]|nr:zinc dependent phospholipase C family protein [Acidobacteriota bacterium]